MIIKIEQNILSHKVAGGPGGPVGLGHPLPVHGRVQGYPEGSVHYNNQLALMPLDGKISITHTITYYLIFQRNWL